MLFEYGIYIALLALVAGGGLLWLAIRLEKGQRLAATAGGFVLIAFAVSWWLLVDPGLPEGTDPRIGTEFPSVRMQAVDDGRWVSTLPAAGQPRMVYFWSTKCERCLVELPVLKRIAEERAGEKLEMILIAEEEIGQQRAFAPLRETGLHSWRVQEADVEVAFFRDPKTNARIAPTTYLLDRKGIVQRIYTGPRAKRRILAAVDDFMSEQ